MDRGSILTVNVQPSGRERGRHNYLAGLYAALPEAAPFEKIYYGQWQTWLIDNVLVKYLQLFSNAKMSFVSPFISRTLTQYMATVPLDKKLEGLRGNTFVKQALGTALPDEIIHKVKHKFLSRFLNGSGERRTGYFTTRC